MTIAGDCPPLPRWTFTQGIILGQASIIILAILFLKYVVFEDPSVAKAQAHAKAASRANKRNNPPNPLLSSASAVPAILAALSYDLPTHAPESLDWLNVLLAQTLTAYRLLVSESKAGDGGGARGLMEEILNMAVNPETVGEGESEPEKPNMVGLDRIEVAEVEIGENFPILSNARVRPSTEAGGVRIELDLDYADHVSLAISTCLVVNFPRPRFAVLPISLGLMLERFSGTLTLELPPPLPSSALPDSTPPQPTVRFSLHPDFTLEVSTTSLLGSRAKLQDIPKVEQLILARLRGWIQDQVVWPQRVEFSLPGFWEEPPVGVGSEGAGTGLHGWEWVEGSVVGDDNNSYSSQASVPNADSDDEEDRQADGAEGRGTRSSKFEEPDGGYPVRPFRSRPPRSPPLLSSDGGQPRRAPSSTGSAPGQFGGVSSAIDPGDVPRPGGRRAERGRWEQRDRAGSDIRYRNTAGLGLGMGSSVAGSAY